jgi:uncharacterized protein YggE
MRATITTIVVFFLCLFLYTKFAGPIPFFINSIQTTKTTLFQVSGVGKQTAVPDTATVSLGVTKNAPTVASAQNQVNTTITAVMNKLQQLGIQDTNIKTTNYSVNPNYGDTQTITGYSVTQTVEVKISPIDKTNQVIDAGTGNGANMIGQVSFGFSDSMQKSLEDKARKEAVLDAKIKAQSLAGAAGIHLGNIVAVSEDNIGQPRPFAGAFALTKQDSTAPTSVTPGENTINLTVTLSYETF